MSMTITAALNLVLAFLEISGLWVCLYLFMKKNRQELRRRKIWYPVSFAGCGVLFLILTIVMNQMELVWIPVIFYFLAVPALGYLLFHRKLWCILLDLVFAALLFFCMEAGIFFMNLMVVFKPADVLLFANLGMLLKLVLMAGVTVISVSLVQKLKEGNLRFRQSAAAVIVPLFSVLFLISLIRMNIVYGQLYSNGLLLLNLTALLFLNCYFIFLFRYQFRNRQLEEELKVFQAQNEIQYRYYEELERKYRESRKILHDMKNHIQAIEGLYRNDGTRAGECYVKDLYHMVNVLGEKYYCRSRMLNIICNDKAAAAAYKGIRTSIQLGDVDLSDIRDIDITTIFANLLDNAIEAAENTEDAFLSFRMQNVRQFRVIRLVNSMNPERKKEGHQGIGLVNVQRTLEKYHGTIRQETVDNEYRVSVLLPGKEEKEK